MISLGIEVIIINSVKAIIDDWDPIDLLYHAPDDEYNMEIAEIEQMVKSTGGDVRLLASEIYDLFLRSFGEVTFKTPYSECVSVAKKIIEGTMGR